MDRLQLEDIVTDKSLVNLLPESLARQYKAIIVGGKENLIQLAIVEDFESKAIDDIKVFVKRDIEILIKREEDILSAIDRYYSRKNIEDILGELENLYTMNPVYVDEEVEMLEVSSSPIVKIINYLIEDGVRKKASDIHIDPMDKFIQIRFRIDGILHRILDLDKSNLAGIVTRIKIMGKMNIGEKRLPQDGRTKLIIDEKEIDIRISILPTINGEKVVMRLLDKSIFEFKTENLGMEVDELKIFSEILLNSSGMILVTGPTGSGKTTTLYAAIQELNRIDKNIITLEDPVEYTMGGVIQVQINEKAGLSFPVGLRSILRQDPDVLMIGEIRDKETAEIGIKSAITGHLVLATLHTKDSVSGILRLKNMGIESYLISGSILIIVAQRLMRKLCPECKEEYKASMEEKFLLDITEDVDINLYRPVGCPKCNSGYRGRKGIYEILEINDEIKELINRDDSIGRIYNTNFKYSNSLLDNAKNTVLGGDTSIEELLTIKLGK